MASTESEITDFFSSKNFETSRRFSSTLDYSTKPLLALLQRTGNPHHYFKSLHIAGTVGKGSLATYLARMISQKTVCGLYTSPHLQTLRERIMINDHMISANELSAIWNIVKPHPHENITYLDCLTALAFHFFAKKAPWAVIETGLGGRKDSTNVILPEASILTTIDFDHQNILGHTLKQIAIEKAGIIKPEKKVFSVLQNPEVMDVIQNECRLKNAPLFIFEEKHQLYTEHNYAFARFIYLNLFNERPPAIELSIPGRFETLNQTPLIIFDGGHNLKSVIETAKMMKSVPGDCWNIYLNSLLERNPFDMVKHFQENLREKNINFYLLIPEQENYHIEIPAPFSQWIKPVHEIELESYLQNRHCQHLVFGSFRFYSILKKILNKFY